MQKSIHVPLRIQKNFSLLNIDYREASPEKFLAPFVAYFWILRFGDTEYPVQTTPTDGGADIIMDLKNLQSPMLFSQSADYFVVPTERNQNIFGVRLHPGATNALFGHPAVDLSDTAIPLELLLQSELMQNYNQILEINKIHEFSDFSHLVHTISSWLKLVIQAVAPKLAHSTAIIASVNNVHPTTTMDTLTELLALSPRQTERRFNRIFGMAPKMYLRIKRFQAVLAAKDLHDDLSWTELSYTYGYYDQSHLNKEFRQFAGSAPTSFFGESHSS